MEGSELTSKFEGRMPMANIEYFKNKMKTERVQFKADPPTGTSNVAIVTGASSGIGLEVTKRLAARGYRVVANSRNITSAMTLQATADLKLVDGDIGLPKTAHSRPDFTAHDPVRGATAQSPVEGER